MACDPIADPFGCITDGIGDIVSQAANDGLQELANQVLEAAGQAIASLGTMWVVVPTPILTGGEGTDRGSGTAPGTSQFTEILGYVSFVGLAIAVLSVIGFAILFMVRSRRGEGIAVIGRLGFVLLAVLLISGASSLVAAILPATAPAGSSSTVGFLQNSLWFYVGGLAVLSVIVASIRMAWEQRAQPGKDLIQSLITLVVVSGAGLLVISLAVAAADAFSVWVLNSSLDCDVREGGDNGCFGRNVGTLIQLGSMGGLGVIGILILGALAVVVTYVQVALMIVRGGLLVILSGILPLTASFTNIPMGKQFFQKTLGWTIAFILYKPAAALIYAAAFSLSGTDVFQDDGGGLWSVLTGLALMVLALVALPALMKFIAPMTSPLGGGGASGMAVAGAVGAVGGDLATGAVQRAGKSAGSGGSSAAPSASGSSAGGAAKGAAGAAKGAGAASGGGAAAGGAAAAGGGGALAAAGPIGAGIAVAGKAAEGVGKAAQAAKGAAQAVTEDSTGSAS